MALGLFAAAVLAAAASLAAHVWLNCPIEPVPSPTPPPTPTPNNLLQRLEKLGEGALDAPEDVHVDAAAGGALYTATRDGWLHRIHPGNGSWERWRFVGGTGLLGITPSADGTMLVCDADRGLLRVGDEGVTLLASEVDGSPIRFADAAIEASDGAVYFSDASTRFGFDRWYHDFFESRATGRLLRYDPRTGHTAVVLDRLGFANGVALPRDEAFVVVQMHEGVAERGEGWPCRDVHRQPPGVSRQHSPRIRRLLLDRPPPVEVAMAGPDHPLELDEESRRHVPGAPRVEQVDDEGSHGGPGVGGRRHHPGARRLAREGDQLRHFGERVQRGHLPRKPRDQLHREVVPGTGDNTEAGHNSFFVEKFSDTNIGSNQNKALFG